MRKMDERQLETVSAGGWIGAAVGGVLGVATGAGLGLLCGGLSTPVLATGCGVAGAQMGSAVEDYLLDW